MNGRKTIAYQGEPGANSHIACRKAYPDLEVMAFPTFEDVFAALAKRQADLAMIPIENTVAGRVADIHHLIPTSGLYIVGEHFLRIRHQLLAAPGARLEDIKEVHSHIHALGQCRRVIAELGLSTHIAADTAGAARALADAGDTGRACIATALAGELYGLETLRADIEDADHNTTRFVIMAADPDDAEPDDEPVITTFVFRVRNVPAALYKAMGGFATNGVNITKLESYQLEGQFHATQFYADVEGHPATRPVRLALEELKFFTSSLNVLGIYKASPTRKVLAEQDRRNHQGA